MSKQINISNVLDALSTGLNELVAKIAKSFEGKIVMGYDSLKFNTRKNRIESDIEAHNSILEDYLELFIEIDPPTGQAEIIQLLKLPPEKMATDLKLTYLKRKQINIPNVNFKLEKLAEAYDFPKEDEDLINSIVEKSIVARKSNEDISDYFNDSIGLFEFSDADEADLLEKYTKYASLDDVSRVISLHLFCEGLSNLKQKDYSFKELPEIDHRIMKMIKIDYHKGAWETGISVDLNKLNNDGGGSAFGITTELTKASIRIKPRS